MDFWDYRTKLEDFIRTETEKMIGQDLREPLAERISNFAGKHARGAGARRKIGIRCPACGGELVTTPFGYGCANYKNDKSGCNFNIGEIAGVQLSEEQVKEILARVCLLEKKKAKIYAIVRICICFRRERQGRHT